VHTGTSRWAESTPLTDVLGVLPRETTYDRLALAGLEPAAVQALLETVVDREVAQRLVATITQETSGNPFFIRAVLLHLLEEGVLARDGASWRLASNLDRIGLPETVRQVIERRLGRLSAAARRLLDVAAAFSEMVHFDVARRVAGLDVAPALDALDEVLGAQLLKAAADPDRFDFAHALVRHTLYGAQSPPRQVRLHREIAETMEAVYGERTTRHATEIARHWHRSAGLPGADRGVPYCLAAAEQAERSTAFADAAAHLRAALDLLPASAPEHVRLHARLGLALVWALRFDDAVAVARDAAARVAAAESPPAAAGYLAEVVEALGAAGAQWSWTGSLAGHGLEYLRARRDASWALLKAVEILERESHDPTGLGIPLDTSERREVAGFFEHARDMAPEVTWGILVFQSRADIQASPTLDQLLFFVGDYRLALRRLYEEAAEIAHKGKIGTEVWLWVNISRFRIALGEFDHAREARKRAVALAERMPEPSNARAQLIAVEDDWRLATDEGWDRPMAELGPGMGQAVEVQGGSRGGISREAHLCQGADPSLQGEAGDHSHGPVADSPRRRWEVAFSPSPPAGWLLRVRLHLAQADGP